MNEEEKKEFFNGIDLMLGGVVKRSYFVQAENVFINNPNYTVYEKMVYLNLATYAGNKSACFPSQTSIAKDLNISRKKVNEVLKRLQELGGVYIIRQIKENGRNSSNMYFLADIDQTTGDFIPECETIEIGKSFPNPMKVRGK